VICPDKNRDVQSCVGFPNCPEGQKRVGKNKIFPVSQFIYGMSIFSFQWFNFLVQFLFSALQVTVECKCRKGLRVIIYQVTRKVKADF